MDVVIHHNDHDHETPVAVANLEDSLTLGLKDVETNGYNNTNVQVHIEVAMQKKESRPFLQASAINNNTVCVCVFAILSPQLRDLPLQKDCCY